MAEASFMGQVYPAQLRANVGGTPRTLGYLMPTGSSYNLPSFSASGLQVGPPSGS